MRLLSFTKKYIKTKVDFDGRYGAQCVDLFRQYCDKVLKIPRTESVVGAVDLFVKYDRMSLEKLYFEKHTYKGQVPKPGDVVVFGATKNNRFGHVAIVVQADENTMLLFEQDGFKQNGAKFNHVDYNRVLGFLRKRES